MKITIERLTLVKLLRQLSGRPVPKGLDPIVRLYASAARALVETTEVTAGVEALVFADGSCRVHRMNHINLLLMYPGKKNLTFEGDARGLRFGGTVMDASDYSPSATPPAQFQVSPVTDAWVAGSGRQPPSRRSDFNNSRTVGASAGRGGAGGGRGSKSERVGEWVCARKILGKRTF